MASIRLGAPLAVAIALLAGPALAEGYRYSPQTPYPPENKAATEAMRNGYYSSEGTDTIWVGPDGKADASPSFNPFGLGTLFGGQSR